MYIREAGHERFSAQRHPAFGASDRARTSLAQGMGAHMPASWHADVATARYEPGWPNLLGLASRVVQIALLLSVRPALLLSL